MVRSRSLLLRQQSDCRSKSVSVRAETTSCMVFEVCDDLIVTLFELSEPRRKSKKFRQTRSEALLAWSVSHAKWIKDDNLELSDNSPSPRTPPDEQLRTDRTLAQALEGPLYTVSTRWQ